MDRLINLLFRWDKLRLAIFEEVHLYDLITERMNEPASINIWQEKDGWRTWEFWPEINRYIFNDVPRETMLEI